MEQLIHWIFLDSIRLPKCHKGLQSKVAYETERIIEWIGMEGMRGIMMGCYTVDTFNTANRTRIWKPDFTTPIKN